MGAFRLWIVGFKMGRIFRMKRVLSLVLLIGLVWMLVGCGNVAQTEQVASGSMTETETKTESVAEMFTVIDASGMELTFDQVPQRIISIAPSETEVLFAIGAGEYIVGVDDWSDYPEEAMGIPKVGGFEMNVEKIVELEPDLVVAVWTMNMKTIEQLRELGITVYASQNDSIDDTINHILTMGELLHLEANAEAIAAKMEDERLQVATALGGLQEADKRKVYIEFSAGWTVGKGEFMDQLLTEAGGINVADEPGWYEITAEKIIEANPDVILYSTGVEELESVIRNRSGWDQIQAMQDDQVIGVDDRILSRPGPRITEALIAVSQAIYPERW
jgi:iron complex transport system substrate-binding protein